MNVDTDHLAGVGQMAFSSLVMFGDTDQAREGVAAFNEKRPPTSPRIGPTSSNDVEKAVARE
jgi:1,4-dihydroxy-2-naphthoyl-CoA synthase